MTDYVLRDTRELDRADVLGLYQANRWSSAAKPDLLMTALGNSHAVVTAWAGAQLVSCFAPSTWRRPSRPR